MTGDYDWSILIINMSETKDEKMFGGKITDLSPGKMSGDNIKITDHSAETEEKRFMASMNPPKLVGKGPINNFLRGIQHLGDKPKDRGEVKPTTVSSVQASKSTTGK